jgi:hypothetical protein
MRGGIDGRVQVKKDKSAIEKIGKKLMFLSFEGGK